MTALRLPSWSSAGGYALRAGPGARVLLGIGMVIALVLPAIRQIRNSSRVLRGQVPFPMDLEWMEGGALYHGWRFAHGEPVYGPPSQGFVPYPYPPLHFVVLALVGKLAGFDYAPARLVS